MTRINAGIPPADLSNRHLIAEHREIKRIPNTIKSGKARVENIPEFFTLGKGHVKFFYNKLAYLRRRYESIYDECIRRGINVTPFHQAFHGVPPELDNDWQPTRQAIKLIRKRISERNG